MNRKLHALPIAVPTLCAALFFAACSSSNNGATPSLASIALPADGGLFPYDAGDQGLSKPEGMTVTSDGRVWVVMTNLDSNYEVAGPAVLAGVVPSTGATTVVNLGAGFNDGGVDDNHFCTNAGQVKVDDNMLVAPCTGGFSADTRGQAVVQVDPSTGTLLHTVTAPAGFQPSSIAGGAPSKIWVGDTNSTTLISVTRSNFLLADGADASHPAIALPCTDSADAYLYTSDLLADGTDLFALCSGDPDGYIVQLDSTTGAVKGTAQLVGATPVAMALLGDGRIAVVNSIDETLALVTRGAGTAGPTVQRAAYTFAMGASLQDVKARGMLLFTVSSGTNTVQKLDLSIADSTRWLVDEKATGDNTFPWNIAPLDDDQAVVSNNGTNALIGLKFGAADAGN